MTLQETLGDIRIPDRERCRHEPAAECDIGQNLGDQARRSPAGEGQPEDKQHLDDDSAVQHMRGQRDREILRQGPRRGIGEAEGCIGQI